MVLGATIHDGGGPQESNIKIIGRVFQGDYDAQDHDPLPDSRSAVPTGLTTDIIILDTLDITLTVRCPACNKIYKWKQKDAWIEGQEK